jgi:hypothetical protein
MAPPRRSHLSRGYVRASDQKADDLPLPRLIHPVIYAFRGEIAKHWPWVQRRECRRG